MPVWRAPDGFHVELAFLLVAPPACVVAAVRVVPAAVVCVVVVPEVVAVAGVRLTGVDVVVVVSQLTSRAALAQAIAQR